LAGLLRDEKSSLRLVLERLNLQGSSTKKLRVLVTNYYDPFGEADKVGEICRDYDYVDANLLHFHLDYDELEFLRSGLRRLNANIASEVLNAQQHYSNLDIKLVNLGDTMKEHGFCSDAPWVYGPSIDFSVLHHGSPAPFHPTIEGQEAIYEEVKSQL